MNRTDLARVLYKVLMDRCGASAFWKDTFVHWFTTDDPSWSREYRFQGTLGFGGKFWRNNGRFYVSCYSEDVSPARQSTMDHANAELAQYPYPKEWS